jgi:hypothetical protein
MQAVSSIAVRVITNEMLGVIGAARASDRGSGTRTTGNVCLCKLFSRPVRCR